jgi:hypothetical protein
MHLLGWFESICCSNGYGHLIAVAFLDWSCRQILDLLLVDLVEQSESPFPSISRSQPLLIFGFNRLKSPFPSICVPSPLMKSSRAHSRNRQTALRMAFDAIGSQRDRVDGGRIPTGPNVQLDQSNPALFQAPSPIPGLRYILFHSNWLQSGSCQFWGRLVLWTVR